MKCIECGKEFKQTKWFSWQKFCSKYCRNKNHNRKQMLRFAEKNGYKKS